MHLLEENKSPELEGKTISDVFQQSIKRQAALNQCNFDKKTLKDFINQHHEINARPEIKDR